jgi:hypothetical protein
VRGVYLGHPVSGRYKYRDLALEVGESQELGQYNMVLSHAGLRLEWDCAAEDQQQITDPSSRQRGRYKVANPQLSKESFKEKEKLA